MTHWSMTSAFRNTAVEAVTWSKRFLCCKWKCSFRLSLHLYAPVSFFIFLACSRWCAVISEVCLFQGQQGAWPHCFTMQSWTQPKVSTAVLKSKSQFFWPTGFGIGPRRVGGDFAGATSGPTIFTRSALTPEVSHIGFHSCFQSHLPEHVSRRTLVRVLLRSC